MRSVGSACSHILAVVSSSLAPKAQVSDQSRLHLKERVRGQMGMTRAKEGGDGQGIKQKRTEWLVGRVI